MVEDQAPQTGVTDVLSDATKAELWGYSPLDNRANTSITTRLQATLDKPSVTSYAPQRYKRRITPAQVLLPCVGALCGLLAIVTMGGYTNLRDIPLPLILIVCGIILLSYFKYRSSAAYHRNGAIFEQMMYHYHTNNGINKQAVKSALMGKPEEV